MTKTYDAVIVGARCAGSPLALVLARAGWDVLLVERDEFPSDVISSHFLFPNTVARLDELGLLERLRKDHELAFVQSRLSILGHDVRGAWTPVGGFDRGLCIRRRTLDTVLAQAAVEAGATARFRSKVVGLLGNGRVAGVALDDGTEVRARWVLGCDGRSSTLARLLGLPKEREKAGEMAIVFAYFEGVPDDGSSSLIVHDDREALNRVMCEDGVTLLQFTSTPEVTRGDEADRARRLDEALRRFPELVSEDEAAAAKRISPIFTAPETMMRGFFRPAAGPGWALVGDAGHFKHPATAQGIGDALEQAVSVAERLTSGDDPSLSTYGPWRDERADGHYDWSFTWATWPVPEVAHKLFAGVESEADAQQDLRDSFSRLVPPAAVFSPDRLARWFA